MSIEKVVLEKMLEAAIFAAEEPLSIARMQELFGEADQPSKNEIRAALQSLETIYAERGIELKEVSSGYRFQVRLDFANYVKQLWAEQPPKYSRATLETLAIIAYKQPVTRSEIEDIRGVTVSTQIIKTLMDRGWIDEVGQKETVGRPMLYATTKAFLDYFSLQSLSDLPELKPVADIEEAAKQLPMTFEPAAAPVIEARVDVIVDESNEALPEPEEEKVELDDILQSLDALNQKMTSLQQKEEPVAEVKVESELVTEKVE